MGVFDTLDSTYIKLHFLWRLWVSFPPQLSLHCYNSIGPSQSIQKSCLQNQVTCSKDNWSLKGYSKIFSLETPRVGLRQLYLFCEEDTGKNLIGRQKLDINILSLDIDLVSSHAWSVLSKIRHEGQQLYFLAFIRRLFPLEERIILSSLNRLIKKVLQNQLIVLSFCSILTERRTKLY